MEVSPPQICTVFLLEFEEVLIPGPFPIHLALSRRIVLCMSKELVSRKSFMSDNVSPLSQLAGSFSLP